MRHPLTAFSALTALPVLSALAVAACSPAPSDEPPVETPTPVVLAGVDLNAPLRAIGTEPFWAVEITTDGLVYSGVDRPEQRAPNAGPVVQGTVAEWNAVTTQEQQINIILTATDCSDGMSDRTYPLAARVTIGEETLNGCAASVEWLQTTSEQG